MLAIAVLAGLFALFATLGVTSATAIIIVVGVIVLPILLARPGYRICAAAWVSSLYPLLLLFSLYATWFTAWLVLGHRPRSSLDDPKLISPLVEVPYKMTYLLMQSSPFSLRASILLMLVHVVHSIWRRKILPGRVAALMLAPVLVWLSVFTILDWGLFGIGNILVWYFD
jgi:hypothetical protein